jgi:hypothetical protein
MRFRKKPVVVDAIQWNGDPNEVIAWAQRFPRCELKFELGAVIVIPTLEGEMLCQRGDWIIRGVAGEFYPCKPDIFAQTYEPATPPEDHQP